MGPGRFLSDPEIERLEGWPEAIERHDVLRFFTPAGEDLAFVREQRGAPNQLAVALQLGALRWLGFVPEDLAAAPPDALAAARAVDQPLDGVERLEVLAGEQHGLLERLAQALCVDAAMGRRWPERRGTRRSVRRASRFRRTPRW